MCALLLLGCCRGSHVACTDTTQLGRGLLTHGSGNPSFPCAFMLGVEYAIWLKESSYCQKVFCLARLLLFPFFVLWLLGGFFVWTHWCFQVTASPAPGPGFVRYKENSEHSPHVIPRVPRSLAHLLLSIFQSLFMSALYITSRFLAVLSRRNWEKHIYPILFPKPFLSSLSFLFLAAVLTLVIYQISIHTWVF